jgi:predicted amidohydrolase YtcJ
MNDSVKLIQTRILKLILIPIYMLFLACSQDSEKADLIIINAKIYSLNWAEPDLNGKASSDAPYDEKGWHPDANSLAIANRKIIFIGNQSEINSYKSDSTKIIDAKGNVVLPGFIDSHAHVEELGEMLRRVNLIGVKTAEEAIERCNKFASKLSEDEWLIGQGWDEGEWAKNYPNREMLDKVFPNRPVVLKSLHGFAIWANSKALEVIGITNKTIAPVGGEILKDKKGQLTGIFLNNATNLMKDGIPQPTDKEFEQYVYDGLMQLARDGYVAIHQAGATSKHVKAFQSLRKKNRLPIRVYTMLSARDKSLSEEWIKRGPYTDSEGWLDIRSVKAYYDAALGSRGARLLEAYSDMPNHKGISGDGYGFDGERVKNLMKAGFQIGVHAIGDAGNRETLDYFESIYKEFPATKGQRNRIEHAQVISPEDFPRFKDLSLIASMEPPHAVEDKTWAETRLGSERIKGAYAWRTLRRENVRLTFNSDLPGSDHSIFYGLHSAITRQDKNYQPENGWYNEQSMIAEEALRAYTNWAAYSAFREKDTGVLSVGRWADISIIDIDILQVAEKDAKKLLDGSILMTIVNGRVVFRTL